MKIEATDAMLDSYQTCVEHGRITFSAYEYAKARGYTDAEIISQIDRVRVSRARLELQGAPLKYKPELPLSNPSDPSPEWMAKAGHLVSKVTVGAGEHVPTRLHRIRNPIEQHADKFGDDAKTAIERLLQDSVYSERVRVANLHSSGGGSHSRLGGLGNVPQHVRDAHARYEWVWNNLGPKLQATAAALVFREMELPNGSLFSMADFGGYILPSVKDKERRWGISAGMLVALAEHLIGLYKACPIKIRRIDEDERRLECRR